MLPVCTDSPPLPLRERGWGRGGSTPSEAHIHPRPQGPPRFVEPLAGRQPYPGVAQLIEVFAVGLVEQVVHTPAEPEMLIEAICPVDRQQTEPGALVEVPAGHVAPAFRDPGLRSDYPPEAADTDVVPLPGQSQPSFQRRHLRKHLAV